MYRIVNIAFVLVLLLSSCGTVAPKYNYEELARASIALGMDIDYDDNHKLYVEASKWIGVPYRYGGTSRTGTDCSGFVSAVYKKVFKVRLSRTADEQLRHDCRKISKRNLEEGDLVFFRSRRRSRTASHVGIYLKNGFFVHSSVRFGVIVSNLAEDYYDKMWLSGGKVIK